MRAFRWLFISGAVVVGVLVLAIAIGALWLNSFIHSAAFKTEVETRAGESLGGPVQIDKIDFDLLRGVKLQGLVTRIDLSRFGSHGTLDANIASVNCSYSWSEIFSRKLKLTGVTLDKPQLVLSNQPPSSLPPLNPSAPVSLPASEGTSSSTIAPSAPGGTTTSASQPADPPASSGDSSAPFQFVMEHAKISDGSLVVRDAGASTLELQGLDLTAKTSDGAASEMTGNVAVTNAIVVSNIQIEDFATPYVYHFGSFQATPFGATAFKGKVAGGFTLGGGNQSMLELNGKGLDLLEILKALAPGSSTTLSGSLNFQSKWPGVETGIITGEGDAELTGGKLQGVRILQEIGSVLKIKELNDPIISKAQTHFQVANQQTLLTGLQIDSDGFRMTGDGAVRFDSMLNLNLVLILSKSAMNRLPKEVAASFIQQQDGTGSIAFHVQGPASSPQTDLPTRLLMQNTEVKKVINNALKRLFH